MTAIGLVPTDTVDLPATRGGPAPAERRAWGVALEGVRRQPSLRGPVVASLLTILVGFGGFLSWGFMARLDSAAVAPGMVIADSHRKTIQHLEGGILRALLVRDGDAVQAGQPLARLDDTAAAAVLRQLEDRRAAALVQEGRLRAEQADARRIIPPSPLLSTADTPAIAALIAAEDQLFRSRWEAHDGAIALVEQHILQLGDQIEAVEAQALAAATHLALLEEEAATVEGLVARGVERRPRLLELQRQVAELHGDVSELAAQKSGLQQAIGAARLEIVQLGNDRRTEVLAALQDTQAELADLAQQIHAAEDVVRRTEVLAPQDGIIANLRYFTPGGVITPGSPIMDIVPADDPMLIEAKIMPTDIDSIRVGQQAEIQLTAYRQGAMPPLEGEIVTVSADIVTDQRTGAMHYVARVRPDPSSLPDGAMLYPGMPAQVVVPTGERRAIDYFIAPIARSMDNAFREE